MRTVGTTSRGVRCPVVREGDDLVKIVTDAILACGEEQGLTFHDRDIVAVTEAVVARSQGNYAGVEDIAAECRAKFGADTVALTFPILSRNRIAICLKGIAKAFKKVYILMSYPSDEVGNHLFDEDLLDEKGVNPWSDVLDEAKYRELFGYEKHPFTGVDYVEYYGDLFRAEGCEPGIPVRKRRARRAAVYKECAVLRHPHPRALQAPPAGCGRGKGAAAERSL